MQKVFSGMVLGIFLTISGALTYEAVRYQTLATPPSAMPTEKPFIKFSVDPGWLRSGTPTFRNVESSSSPDGKSISGLWTCEGPASFEWTYYTDETIHLLEGQVDIEYLGRRFTLKPGDTATFHAGTKAFWNVPGNVKKSYTLYQPSLLVRLWRRVVAA